MPKVKMKRSSTFVDMTAMCDVAFLLLTFFILTSKFRPQDPVQIDVPASVSERKIKDSEIMIVQVDKEGRVFWGTDNADIRERTLKKMMARNPTVKFDQADVDKFKSVESFGLPYSQLPAMLRGEIANDGKSPGIPLDSLKSPIRKNELGEWLLCAREAHLDYTVANFPKRNEGKEFGPEQMLKHEWIRLALKGDGVTEYPKIEKILATFKDKAISKFDLITGLKGGETASKAPSPSGGH
jgi:biopolymer transport protein ExbD